VSDDGKQQSSCASDIQRYEKGLLFNQIERKVITSNFLEYENWYRLKNEDEITIFKSHYNWNNVDHLYDEYLKINWEDTDGFSLELPLNEWFTVYYSDGGDHRSTYHIFTLKYLMEDFENILNQLGVKTNG